MLVLMDITVAPVEQGLSEALVERQEACDSTDMMSNLSVCQNVSICQVFQKKIWRFLVSLMPFLSKMDRGVTGGDVIHSRGVSASGVENIISLNVWVLSPHLVSPCWVPLSDTRPTVTVMIVWSLICLLMFSHSPSGGEVKYCLASTQNWLFYGFFSISGQLGVLL